MKTTSVIKANSFLLVFLLLSCVYACQTDQTKEAEQAITMEATDAENVKAVFTKLNIDAPFEKVKNPSQELVIKNPAKAYTFRMESGAYIKVPANAFQTAAGEPVAGEITLSYKSFQTAAEIITSGIPMKVNKETGGTDQMRTGGMFEIRATSNGSPVSLIADKEVEVSIVSASPGNFDVWAFDESAGNWTTTASDHLAKEEVAKDAALEKTIQSLEKETASPPIDPDAGTAYKLIFNDLDLKYCPNLKGQSPIALSYIGTDKKKDPKENTWIKNPGIWYKKELKPLDAKADKYTLTLYGDDIYQIPVKVVLQGAALEKAKAKYQSLLAQHQKQLAVLKDKKALRKNQTAFRRTIAVSGLGIHNFDVIYDPSATPFEAVFDFGPAADIYKDVVDVYLITANNSVVVRLPGTGKKSFQYNANTDNKLIAVLPEDKIATFTQADFNREAPKLKKAKGGQYVFNMNLSEGSITSVKDLEEIVTRASSFTSTAALANRNTQEGTTGGIEPTRGSTTNLRKPVSIKVFPNPTTNLLNVDLSNLANTAGRLALSNQTGQLVKERTIEAINNAPVQLSLGDLASGPYFLSVISNGRLVSTETVMVQ